MKYKYEDTQRNDVFSRISIIIALLVILLMGSAIAAIIIGGITNFKEAINSDEVRFAIRLSSLTATVSTIICMSLALPTSYALTRTKMPFKRPLSVLLELTLSMPYLLLGLSLLIIFSSDFGKVLKEMGIKVIFTQLGIVMAQVMVNLPFCIRMVRTAFSDVEERLEYIARFLGASKFKSFITITLPLRKSALVSTFILTWSRALGEFGATLMLVGITRMKTETLPGSIYLDISTGQNGMAMATAMMILIISGIALILSNLIQERNIGFVYQDYGLFPHMTVRKNIAYGLKMRRYSKEEIEEKTEYIMELFSINHISSKFPTTISGGESQRTALARTLVLNPQILLLDEPFAALT